MVTHTAVDYWLALPWSEVCAWSEEAAAAQRPEV